MNTVTLSKNSISTGDLILVNRNHGLAGAYIEGLVPVHGDFPSMQLQSRAAAALGRLMQDIDGWKSIVPVSAWRSLQEQQQIWDGSIRENGLEFTKKYVALPGHSEHQSGLAIDLGFKQEHIDFICPEFPETGICGIFQKKAAAYGFILRYPAGKEPVTGIGHEPWHFRYVGVPHAQVMSENGMTLEEYTDFLRQYPYGKSVFLVKDGRNTAFISYIGFTRGNFSLELPENCTFSVSGNNVDGFILTEWRDTDEHQKKLRRT